jgi:hypothetical protein
MGTIPPAAVERFARLRERADASFAAARDANEAWHHLRTELSRLESNLQRHAGGTGRKLAADDDGSVYYIQEHRRQVVSDEAPCGYYYELEDRKVPFPSAPAAEVGREIAALRRQVREAQARRDRLGEASSVFGQLANRCEEELRRRG